MSEADAEIKHANSRLRWRHIIPFVNNLKRFPKEFDPKGISLTVGNGNEPFRFNFMAGVEKEGLGAKALKTLEVFWNTLQEKNCLAKVSKEESLVTSAVIRKYIELRLLCPLRFFRRRCVPLKPSSAMESFSSMHAMGSQRVPEAVQTTLQCFIASGRLLIYLFIHLFVIIFSKVTFHTSVFCELESLALLSFLHWPPGRVAPPRAMFLPPSRPHLPGFAPRFHCFPERMTARRPGRWGSSFYNPIRRFMSRYDVNNR